MSSARTHFRAQNPKPCLPQMFRRSSLPGDSRFSSPAERTRTTTGGFDIIPISMMELKSTDSRNLAETTQQVVNPVDAELVLSKLCILPSPRSILTAEDFIKEFRKQVDGLWGIGQWVEGYFRHHVRLLKP